MPSLLNRLAPRGLKPEDVIETFDAASLGGKSWLDALSGLAAITGSRAGELIGLGSRHSVPFNWCAGMEPEWAPKFRAIGGGNPDFNPVVRAGSVAGELEVRQTSEFISKRDRVTSPFLAEHCVEFDIPHVCLSPLIKSDEMLVGLAVLRSAKQGEITRSQRAVFERLAPVIRNAVRTQIALEHQGAGIMAATLEAVSISAFVCNWLGLVKAMTPSAERIVSEGAWLNLRNGCLTTRHPGRSAELGAAIQAAAYAARPSGPMVFLSEQRAPFVLEVLPVPKADSAFRFDPRVLVVAHHSMDRAERLSLVFRFAYGLTEAEVQVTRQLLEGLTPVEIAAARVVSVGTVRSQIKAVFSKLQIHNLGGLLALATRFN